ncbi:hypothetical protein [Streptomyces sp. AD55]|uniref:hypothetical protein n=1 Tax=Streptomyces sp. AD55 TaxID=3242895 RepID=UPI0035283045
MADDPAYVDTLASQLRCRHASLLATAEDDLAVLRARIAIVADWIHEDIWDDTARRALAQRLGLPEPRQPEPR